jgi:uncharacterized repeat protein (TIGR03803 family)
MKKSYLIILLFAFIGYSHTANAQYTKLLDFNGTNGKNPYGSLMSDGSFLYGMTTYGGANGNGTIFKIKPDGTGYATLLDFNGTNGMYPEGSLIYDGTFLYGMTVTGGANGTSGSRTGYGTIFKIKPDGTGYVKILDFDDITNGHHPYGDLISDGTFLYGMTSAGGANHYGTAFKIKPDGTGYATLIDFNGSTNGRSPQGSLISDGTFLYGMTEYGGTGYGNIFKIKPDGTGYATLLDFNGTNGSNPLGSLIYDGSFLYGMTYFGGANNHGTIFKIKPDGTGFVKLLDFNGATNGRNPCGSLIYDGTFLYGMISGDWNGYGNIFKIKPDGTVYATLLYFNSTNGSTPSGSLISDGTFLYGMTSAGGGPSDSGTIFKYSFTAPTQPVAITGNTSVCSGTVNTYSVAAVPAATSYTWSLPSGWIGTSTTDSITVTVGTTGGNIIVTANNSYGSSVAQTAMITVNALPPTPIITTSGASTFCEGDSVILTASAGNSYLWSNGKTTQSNTITTSGNYSVKITNANGCSATSSATTVTVNALPPTPTITASGAILTSSAASGNQWYLNSVIIVGATAKSYTATKNGNYSVVVTNAQSCSASSAIFALSAVGIAGIENSNSFVIYPNPNKGDFTIEGTVANKELVITNVLGELIFKTKTNSGKTEISLSNMPAGIYFLQINTENGIISKKVFIQD